jgi:signal transduction histidine kinase
VLKLFPEGILIQTVDKEGKRNLDFTNDEFKNKVARTDLSVKKSKDLNLRDIPIKIEHNDTNSKSTLHQFINSRSGEEDEENNILIKYTDKIVIENEVRTERKYINFTKTYRVKTIKVNWNLEMNSIMHVFVETTDVIKLEEAKNHIRCQKIMFTTSSHELRTPLNGIMNSLNLLTHNYQDIINLFQSNISKGLILLHKNNHQLYNMI